MNYINSIKKQLLQATFYPGWISFFFSPSHLFRKGLYGALIKYSGRLSGKLLDFGCGEKPYRHLFQVDEYIGLDHQSSGHDNKKNSIEILWDGQKVPCESNSFDSILCTEVYEHLFNIESVISEQHRVLRKGGLMLITTPFTMPEHEAPFDYCRYTEFGLRHILEKEGFQILEFDKIVGFGGTLCQLIRIYLGDILKTNIDILDVVIRLVILMPLQVILWTIAYILPGGSGLYFGNVVLVKKI